MAKLAKKRLGIMVGLPRSGKTTYARKMASQNGWVIISPDDFRIALHGGTYVTEAEGMVWAILQIAVRAALRSNDHVLIDATNTTRSRRNMWVRMAREFGIALEAYVIDTPLEECHKRNKENLPSMPSSVIDRMAEQFEPVQEPEVIPTIVRHTGSSISIKVRQ